MRRARWRSASWLVAAVIVLSSAAGSCAGDEQPSPAPATTPAEVPVIEPPAKVALSVTVQRVVDVRTVQLSDGEELTVKGLAAPDGCWSEASTTFAKSMLLEKPVDPTPTGSLLLADGTDYALLAVELGMVRTEAADDRAMQEAERTASERRLGRWGPPCVQPASATPPPPVKPTSTPPPTPKPVTGCSVDYRVTHTWPGGFRTDVTIRNTGDAEITGWTLQWKFANDQKVSEMWNATPNQSGQDVSATAMPYNQTIPKGESLLMGFTGTSGRTNTSPNAFSLNGHACRLG